MFHTCTKSFFREGHIQSLRIMCNNLETSGKPCPETKYLFQVNKDDTTITYADGILASRACGR